MKTKLTLLSLLLSFTTFTFAQEVYESQQAGYKTPFKHNSAGSNWFIQLGAGAQYLVAEGFEDNFFTSDGITLAPTFAVGKWFTPTLGFRLKGEGGDLHSFLSYTKKSFMQKDRYYDGHVDALWNVSNYWGKYNSKKVFSFIPYLGAGMYYREEGAKNNQIPGMPYMGTSSATFRQDNDAKTGLSLHAGLLFQFRLSDHVGLHLDIAGLLADDYFNRVIGDLRYEGVASVTGGLTFNLGKTSFEPAEGTDMALINDLNNRINALRGERDALAAQLPCKKCPTVETPKPCPPVDTDVAYVPNVVRFRLNSSVIDEDQKVSIFNTAAFMKNSGEKIRVIGYADKGTGTNSINMKLSEQRAKAVAKELMNTYKIPSDRIIVEWKGSNEQPYKENNWNRVVIMSAQDK